MASSGLDTSYEGGDRIRRAEELPLQVMPMTWGAWRALRHPPSSPRSGTRGERTASAITSANET